MSAKVRKVATVFVFLLIILTLAFIWGNSLQSRESSGELSNSLLSLVNVYLHYFGIELKDDYLLRKLAHFSEFCLLELEVFCLLLLRKTGRSKRVFYSLAVCIIVAAIDEGIQYFSGRACRLSDVALDVCGSFFALIMIRLVSFSNMLL